MPNFTIIEPHERDLGSFTVRRILPNAQCKMVGPFIFFDEMGPAQFAPGQGMDVRPHPHIGLATVTYLFEGEIWHRDCLGYVQPIRPGDVNWMTAGRGIVHSERTGPEARAAGIKMHGIQSWVALPTAHQEVDPSFHHYPSRDLPELKQEGVHLRLIAGSAYGLISPVVTFSKMFYMDAAMTAGSTLVMPEVYPEQGIYLVEGQLMVEDQLLMPHQMLINKASAPLTLRALTDTRVMLLGGEPLDGERIQWWNFVSSSQERIEQAKTAWINNQFLPVPGETEFIPLPDH